MMKNSIDPLYFSMPHGENYTFKKDSSFGNCQWRYGQMPKNKIIVELNYFLKANLKSSDLNINEIWKCNT